jgi:cation:H+ antiporter
MAWLLFLLSGAIIVVAGTKLSQYGDRIARHTGLGGMWIGVVLLAGATSLPEVFTSISAAWLGAPDLAAGDLFGAGMTNMLTLGLIDLLYRDKRVWRQTALEQTLIAGVAVTLTGVAGLFLLAGTSPAWPGMGTETLLIAALYVLGMRIVFRQEDMRRREKELTRMVEAAEEQRRDGTGRTLHATWIGFAMAAAAIAVAAPMLAISANEITAITGLSATFIGTTLVAVTTSLPELVTAVAAVRLGAFDLAVGNLYGSNAFNIAALCLADLAYRPGPLLGAVSTTHAVTALISILLMNVGLIGIVYRAERRYWLIEPDSLTMILGYGLGLWLLYRLNG